MQFVVFIILLFALCQFHRREHQRLAPELRGLLQTASNGALPAEADWQVIRTDGNILHLRRAFMLKSNFDRLRYFLPIAFLAVMLIALQSWMMAGIYAAIICIKWFVTSIRLDIKRERYDVTIFSVAVFGEQLVV